MASEVLPPERAGIQLAPRFGDPTAVRIHRNSSPQITWVCLEASACVFPAYDPLRSDERFIRLLEQIGPRQLAGRLP